MLTGLPPYYSNNRHIMYQKIKNEELKVPNFLSHEAKNIVLSLLNKNPEKRLGYKNGF